MGFLGLSRRKRPGEAKDAALVPEASSIDVAGQEPTGGQAAKGRGGGLSSGGNPVDMAPTGLQDAESVSKDVEPAPESLAWDDLWTEAYETLKGNSEYTKLLVAFEKYVIDGMAVDETKTTLPEPSQTTSGAEKLKQIQKLAEEKLQKLPEARLSFAIGNTEIVVREVVQKSISVVTAFKDILGAAISAEPCAGLAWAGIMSILPLIGNSLKQDEDAESGLKNIVFLLVRYQRLQGEVLATESLRYSLSESACRVFSEIRTKLVGLYSQIYEYEIRFVLQYTRGRVHRASRNAMAADDWKSKWATIKSTSQMIDQAVQEHVGARTLEAVNDIITRAENIENLQQETLKSVKTNNQTQLILSLPCSMNAIFDSADIIGKEAPCLDGTRRDVLNRIQDWAESPTGEVIFWLHGMAGTGKTSVALTVATALNTRRPFTEGRQPLQSVFLGASFFFKQDDITRNGTKTFFPTIARRLAQGFPDIGAKIAHAVEKNLEIGTKAPQQQLDGLVFSPLSVIDKQTFIPVRLVVVVDALDECIDQKELDDLVGMLKVLEDLHKVQLRLLITSRRDDHILRSFEKLPIEMYNRSLLDKVRSPAKEDNEVDDITKYLIYTLSKIAAERDVPANWINGDGIASLSKKADGLFIYAATICRFLDCEDFDDEEAREERLEQILSDEIETDAPQQKVDEIYLKVLSFPHLSKLTRKSQMRFYDKTKRILGFITAFFEPVSILSLSALLTIDKEDLNKTLRRFHSILDVPQDEHAPLGLVHLSFRDFLLSKERSSKLPFQVEEISMHREVFEACLSLMSQKLQQDMCKLAMPGHLASDVPPSQIDRDIPQYLRYACRYWVDHLAKLIDDQCKEVGLADGKLVHLFVGEKLLFWIEAMSLIREMSAAITIIDKLGTIIDPTESPILSGLVHDARRFMLSNKVAIENAPLQLYSSALIFSPSKSRVRSQFKHLVPSWITQVGEPEEDWAVELYKLQGHRGAVTSVSFSPLSNLLVSGSLRGSKWGETKVWNYVTGTELYKFQDYNIVYCVAFSPDGKWVASGILGGIITVREFAKGRSIDLIGHTNSVHSIAFSPKSSNILASISGDKSLRIWDIAKRQASHILDVSLQYATLDTIQLWVSVLDIEFPPRGVVFSPGGDFVAVGSNKGSQGSVTLWGVEKGELKMTFKGHETYVPAIAISMDNKTIISGSADGAIKVWDAETGQIQACYKGRIKTIVFCPPNGEYVIVSLYDTVEIRRVDTWELVRSVGLSSFYDLSLFRGGDLSLSRDGRFFAKDNKDSTIGLYDMRIDMWRTSSDVPRQGSSSIKFLPGEDNVVLTSTRGVWQLWDANNTLIHFTRAEGSLQCFSPDKKLIGIVTTYGIATIWSSRMEREIARYDKTRGMVFSPTSSCIALQLAHTIRIIDLTTLEEMAELDSTYEEPFGFSPDSRILAWIDKSRRIHFSDLLANTEVVGRICDSFDKITFMANWDLRAKITFSPNGELVALTGSFEDNHDISLVEVATGKERAAISAEYWKLPTFHPAGHLLAAGDIGIAAWNTASGDKIRTFKLDNFKRCGVDALAVSTDGQLVAASGTARDRDDAIQLWNFSTGTTLRILRFFPGYSTLNHSLWFSDDAQYLETHRGRVMILPPITDKAAALNDVSLETAESCLDSYLGITFPWVLLGRDKILWLPGGFHGSSLAVRGETLAIGRTGGQVTYLRFDISKMAISSQSKALLEGK